MFIERLNGPGKSRNFFISVFAPTSMTDKIGQARREIENLETRAANIMEEIKFLVESDPRMKSDDVYRNSMINDKLKEIHLLQEKSQVYQQHIMQATNTGKMTAPGRVTRSQSTAVASEASNKLSAVAANLQRMSRQAASASRDLPSQRITSPALEERISEEDQKRSVHALLTTRNWLQSREYELGERLESEGLHANALSMTDADRNSYALLQSIRVRTDVICATLQKQSKPDQQLVEELRSIVHYVTTVGGQLSN